MKAEINLAELVSDLNQELYDRFKEVEFCFDYSTNGMCDSILFGEYLLWTSEIDDREFDEEKNDYEPFDTYIRKTFNNYIDRLNSLKL